ncbi:MAG: DUF11 domain-containing protein [Anaerolineales bacterium]|nr:DUF11 domain-containing protein [Anaerolineales bacterium]
MNVLRMVRVLVLLIALAGLIMIPPPLEEALASGPWYVAEGGDDTNDCLDPLSACATINGAIGKATSGDTVYVDSGTYMSASGFVVSIDKDLTLSGGWDSSFLSQTGMTTLDGEETYRGLLLNLNMTATVERFIIQNGYGGDGGGIWNWGTLTLNDSIVRDNSANWGSGGIINHRTMTINNSTISGNTAEDAGGISNGGEGIMTINDSIISDNVVQDNGGGISNGGDLTINNTLITGNTANRGGGIFNVGILSLNNSTLSGNTATTGGGLLRENCSCYTADLNNSTISGNKAVDGGGVYDYGSGSITLRNTILAGNTATNSAPDCYDTVYSSGYNLLGDTSGCTFAPTTGDLTGLDPQLGPLQDNGGPTSTHALLYGSPALDAGNPGGCTDEEGGALPTDQRGLPRVGRCDMGAFEAQELEISFKAVTPFVSSPGNSITYEIGLNNIGASTINNIDISDTLPTSITYIDNSLTATAGTYGFSGGVITWNGAVEGDSTVTITFRARVNLDAPLGESIDNTALITWNGDSLSRTASFYVHVGVCDLTKFAGNPVLSPGTGGAWDDNGVFDPTVLKDGGTLMMWYSGDDGLGSYQIGLATSSDGLGWAKESTNPVRAPSETWESGGIRVGSVIQDGGYYKMWYTGYDLSGVGQIGYDYSVDGINWLGTLTSPVLEIGAPDGWEDSDVTDPSVILIDGTYHMWYTGYDGMTARIGHAISSDGLVWEKDHTNPIMDLGEPSSWDWLNVYGPEVVHHKDTYLLWYSGETLPRAWQTGYATSLNAVDWTHRGMVVPEGGEGSFDSDGADYASVLSDEGEFDIWYAGHDGSQYAIGHATADICGGGVPDNPIYLPLVLKNASGSPPCEAYYTDDFNDPSSGWPVWEDGNVKYGYTGGEYQILVKNPSQGWLVTPGAKASQYVVSVSARRASGTYGAYGIVFAINEDWSEIYQVLVEDSYYSMWIYRYGSWSPFINWTYSEHINTGTELNRLKVIWDGVDIVYYVNNQHMATFRHSHFHGLKRIGLAAYSPFDSSLDARFDDFFLYPLECGAGATLTADFEMGVPEAIEVPVPPGIEMQ